MKINLSYAEQLRHPLWQKKRLEVLEAAGFKCQGCQNDDQTLHVHHKRYIKGRKAWEYENTDFECLCGTCHEMRHELRACLDEVIAAMPSAALAPLLAVVAGFAYLELGTELSERYMECDAGLYEAGMYARDTRSDLWQIFGIPGGGPGVEV